MPAPRRQLRLLAALFALALLGAACGDDDASGDDPTIQADDGADESADDGGDGAGSDVPDPCALVTLAELEALFEAPFEQGTAADEVELTGTRQCTWSGTDGLTAKVVSIAVATDTAQQAAFGRGAEEIFELTKTAAEGSGSIAEDDLGIGDQSYRSGSNVYVLDGDTTYTFIISGTSEDAIAGLKQLATQVVEG